MIGRRRAISPSACRRSARLTSALLIVGLCGGGGVNEALAQRIRPPRGVPYAGGAGGQYVTARDNAYLMRQSQDEVEFTGPYLYRNKQLSPATSGIQFTIAVRSSGQFGYQPITATITFASAVNTDRKIGISFRAGGWYGDADLLTATGAMTVKQGATSATLSLLVPQFQYWQGCGWEVRIGDEPSDELSFEFANLTQQQQQPGGGVSALIASSSLLPWEFQPALQAIGNSNAAIRSTPPSDLPTDWKYYSGFDLVLLPAGEFAGAAQQYPRQMAALLRWVRTGGNLWLVDAEPTWGELPNVERALGVASAATTDKDEGDRADAPRSQVEADADIVARGWRFVPLGERALEPVEGALVLSGYDLGDAPEPATKSSSGGAAPTSKPIKTVETSQKWFAVRALGMGTVAAFRVDLRDAASPSGSPGPPISRLFDPAFGGDPSMIGREAYEEGGAYGQPMAPIDPAVLQQLTSAQAARYAVQRSLLMPRLAWISRHGNKPDEANLDFNNLLIPDVGEAPVGPFQFLISLFVIAIGPLNYWWFKRRKKLPMLLATVPAAAALVTLMLLSVGVLSDGLGVRVRARSLTLLDQTSGEATTWSRLTYYAGISPRDGLATSRDAVVYPILSPWSEGRGWRRNMVKRSMTWDDKQRLTSGWLSSRTPTQYQTVAARTSEKRLVLRNDDGGLRVVNRLGVTVTHLVVQDHEGKLYWCEGLEPDAGLVVPVAEARDISIKLRRLFLDHYPEFPVGAAPAQQGYNEYGAVLAKNLMEAQLDAINSPVVRRWDDGGYIAVTDHGVDLDLGVDDATEEASFHVIRGTW